VDPDARLPLLVSISAWAYPAFRSRTSSNPHRMEHWRQTYRVPAKITLTTGVIFEGDLHLQTASAAHFGGERPVEMLNREERFFPVSLESGGIELVGKKQIAVVTCDSSLWEIDSQRRAISKRFLLDIHMAGGQHVSGSSWWELPPTHPRMQDFLNAAADFFEVYEGGLNHSVNRALVAHVNPFD